MTTTGQPGAERGQRGQAAVELALVLPLVLLLFLGLVQVGLVVRDDVLLVHAAREAARRAAVDRADGNARVAAINGSGLTASRLDVRTTRDEAAGTVSETLRYRSPTGLPLIGPLLPDITLEAKATMREES
jgi:Flp pilus assembly protein TadG